MIENYKVKLVRAYKNLPKGTVLESVSLGVLADLRRRGCVEDPRDLREAVPFDSSVKKASQDLKRKKKKEIKGS